MKPHEISMKLEKKRKREYLCCPGKKYVFKVKPLFGDYTRTKGHLGHYQTFMMELFCENS